MQVDHQFPADSEQIIFSSYPQFSCINNRDDATCLIRLRCRLSKMIHLNPLTLCLTHSKYSERFMLMVFVLLYCYYFSKCQTVSSLRIKNVGMWAIGFHMVKCFSIGLPRLKKKILQGRLESVLFANLQSLPW